jgi:hypothetical protein
MDQVHADIVATTRAFRASRLSTSTSTRRRRRRDTSSPFEIHEDSGEEEEGAGGVDEAANAAAMRRARLRQVADLRIRSEERRARELIVAEAARRESPTKLIEDRLRGIRMR